jgi:hypothetical protein
MAVVLVVHPIAGSVFPDIEDASCTCFLPLPFTGVCPTPKIPIDLYILPHNTSHTAVGTELHAFGVNENQTPDYTQCIDPANYEPLTGMSISPVAAQFKEWDGHSCSMDL